MDIKNTVFLPKTDFPMRGNLPVLEIEILDNWKTEDLYGQIMAISADYPLYILHDGPPYANGHLHLGHALNKILKDIILKTYRMHGFRAPYVPGWDCHGLPIEWKVEEERRKRKKPRLDSEQEILDFRNECREYAQKWVNVQREEFERLGVLADWKNPYLTMDFSSEAQTVEELFTIVDKGLVFQGVKPVLWSVLEKTALADAEVEYHDIESPSIYVGFPVKTSENPLLVDESHPAYFVIWTTTPWSLPGNRAIAYSPTETYVILQTDSGSRFVLSKTLVETFLAQTGLQGEVVSTMQLGALKGTIAYHPLWEDGYDFNVPLLPGDHVTLDQGTGLVHTAPEHGEEDFALARLFGMQIPQTIGPNGLYLSHVPLFAGDHVFKVGEKIIQILQAKERLVWGGKISHSYPHSWRSKCPLIYRTTPQWFIKLEGDGLRSKALKAIQEDVRWVPSQGQNRLYSMVLRRPDWCVSRQRVWGVPLALFVHKETREPLSDKRVNDRILQAIAKGGGDVWYEGDAYRFLDGYHNREDYEVVSDCIEVWFESGCSHAYVLEARDELRSPADIYVEGSDQHRGWFQSSLLESMATRGVPPYKTILTHGFVLDEKAYKMSKSVGNIISPKSVIETAGADILRLWVVNSDYSQDLKMGPEILKSQQESYRRFRNILRYLLGALSDYDGSVSLEYEELDSLEKLILHKLYGLAESFKSTLNTYEFTAFYGDVHNFVTNDLSAFYLDIRKDILYCDSRLGSPRQGVLYVLNEVLRHLIHWLAPVLSFTAEEAFRYAPFYTGKSIHLEQVPVVENHWKNSELSEEWDRLRDIRRLMMVVLEKARSSGEIGSSLQAKLEIIASSDIYPLLKKTNLADLALVSQVEILCGDPAEGGYLCNDDQNVGVRLGRALGDKCDRCWKVLEEVSVQKDAPSLCYRCKDVVEEFHLGETLYS